MITRKLGSIISYNANGGSGAPVSQEKTYGVNLTLSSTIPTRAEYNFIEWNTAADGSGTSYNPGAIFMYDVETILYAQWEFAMPVFTYTGDYTFINDGNNRWRIKFLTSGTFVSGSQMIIDAFLVGGGGGGSLGGGGGGYTATTSNLVIEAGQSYPITIGNGGNTDNNGGATSAFGNIVNGGFPANSHRGGNGGSGGGHDGGRGGSDGGNGLGDGSYVNGIGQGTTTREFGEITGELYAGGGGGGSASGGGGGGGTSTTAGAANTGGGGGKYTRGGSGIVVIRNSSASEFVGPDFTYSGNYQIINDGISGSTQNWRIRFLTSGTLTFAQDTSVDAFLVGGGGGGSLGGGGGGYTATTSNLAIEAVQPYTIIIGNGGNTDNNGGATSAFGNIVNGGIPANSHRGGNGGSGGGHDGGRGGSDGGNGLGDGSYVNGTGQGTTTREFGEITGELYAGGGGGGSASGGAGGGGTYQIAGAANTGGGGGKYTRGGSGIVIIRNIR